MSYGTFWVIVAAVALVVEIITLGLSSIWFTGGAIVAAVILEKIYMTLGLMMNFYIHQKNIYIINWTIKFKYFAIEMKLLRE